MHRYTAEANLHFKFQWFPRMDLLEYIAFCEYTLTPIWLSYGITYGFYVRKKEVMTHEQTHNGGTMDTSLMFVGSAGPIG